MDENELSQKLLNLRWGTGMPIIAITAAGMSQVRCRGSYSLHVNDLNKLQEKLPEIEQAASWAGSLIVTKVTDAITELTPGLTSAQQLTTKMNEISNMVNNTIKTSLDDAGLVLEQFTIDAMDIL